VRVLHCPVFSIAAHLGNEVNFLPVIAADIQVAEIPEMPHKPF
jgi:hypothetical protein